MTSQVCGMPPSLLTHVRDSRRDRAKDLAALQAMITRHRINHAASALRWRRKGSPRALALAKCRKKSRVSSDHRPPTSQARTTRGPSKLARQLWVSSFLARSGCLQRGPIHCRAPRSRGAIPSQRRHHGGVDGQLGTVVQRQAVRDPPPNVSCLGGPGEGGPCPGQGATYFGQFQLWPGLSSTLANFYFGQSYFGQFKMFTSTLGSSTLANFGPTRK